jgi:hypothetical protein
VGIRCADHVTPSTRKSRHYFTDSGGRSVGIVRLRTKATEFGFIFSEQFDWSIVIYYVEGKIPSINWEQKAAL